MKYLASLLIIVFIVGCQGSSKQKFYTSIKTGWADGTTVETISFGEGSLTSPSNAGDNSTQEINSEGMISNISGNMKKLPGEIEKAGSWIYFAASIVLIVAGIIVAYFKREYVFGAILGLAGILVAGIPTILDELGWIILLLVVLLIVGGVTYILGKYIFRWSLIKRNTPAIIKLNGEGKPEEAMAVARAINPELDKEYKKKSK